MLSYDELMKQRYEVIADYPGQKYQIGDVIPGERSYVAGETDEWSLKVSMKDYPALFKPLQWWEHRKPEDMPEYVKERGGWAVFKVVPGLEHHLRFIDHKIPLDFIHPVNYHYEPATEAEYTQYINSKK